MEDIGKQLKELRIEKDLSIEDVQESTKIRSRYIQAIEDGNLERLPGQFYAKAFIKSYAEVVELDPDVLKEFLESIKIPEAETVPFNTNYHSLANRPSKLGKWLKVSLVYIFIGLIVLLIYMFVVNYSSDEGDNPSGNLGENRLEFLDQNNQNNPENDEDTTDKQNEDGNTSVNEVEPPKEELQISKLSTSLLGAYPLDEYEVIAIQDININLQLKFTERCWFSIKVEGPNGKELLTGTFGPGQETELIPLGQKTWIHLGNASGVEIYINDKKIKAGDERNPKYISIIRTAQKNQ